MLCLSYSDFIAVRLESGNTLNDGFIEIKGSNGIWGGICDDTWSNTYRQHADVVCRMLGYPSAEEVYRESTPFGHGTGSFVLDDVKCVGTETSVFDCPHNGEGVHNCGSTEWAGVKCNTGVSGSPLILFFLLFSALLINLTIFYIIRWVPGLLGKTTH